MTSLKTALIVLGLVWVGIVWAPSSHAEEAEETKGRQLLEEEVLDLFSGTVMFGKYTDGRPDWKEQTSVNGELLDVEQEWVVVGTWTVVSDMVCYRYWEPPGTHCFDVFERDETYYFYLPGTDKLIAHSYKVEKRPMM